MLTNEQIHKMCELQHKITVCEVLIRRMPLGYTNDNIAELERDIDIKTKYEKYQEEQYNMVKQIGVDAIGSTFGNKEFMQKPENRFTFEEQRQATKEVIGKELTLEEFLEQYGILGD